MTPFFVYGTLRPGQALARVWDGPRPLAAPVLEDGAWRLPDHRLVGTGFPYAIEAPGQSVVGTLLMPNDPAVIAVMDSVEGVAHQHYQRDLMNVTPILRPPCRTCGGKGGLPCRECEGDETCRPCPNCEDNTIISGFQVAAWVYRPVRSLDDRYEDRPQVFLNDWARHVAMDEEPGVPAWV